MSVSCRYCCKSPKTRTGQFSAKARNKRQSPINTASNALPESPVSLALGDVVPHIIIQSLHLRGGEFESHLAKRLLQQYLPNPDITDAANSKIYTPLIEVAQSTEGWSALAKAARDDPDGLPLHCVCVEVCCVERRRT